MLKIKALRMENGLTQKQLADMIQLSGHNIGDWEREKCEPSCSDLIKLANALNVSIDYLVGRTDELGIVKRENNALTSSENELLFNFRKLDAVKQNKVLGYCYAMAN